MYWHLLFHISSCWRNIHVLPIFRDILVYRVHGMLFNIHMTARFPFLLCLFDILMLRNSNLKKKELFFRENLHAVDFKRAPPQRTGTDMDPSSKSSIRFVENGNLLYLIIWRCFTSLLKCIDNSINCWFLISMPLLCESGTLCERLWLFESVRRSGARKAKYFADLTQQIMGSKNIEIALSLMCC